MTMYRVYFEVTNFDYLMVEADTPDGAWVAGFQEIRNLGDDVEITEVEVA